MFPKNQQNEETSAIHLDYVVGYPIRLKSLTLYHLDSPRLARE